MKIKNVLKSLAIGALVVPCALAFTGCGKETVKIDTKMPASATSATTCAEASEYFNNTASTESISNGYRMSISVDMDMDFGSGVVIETTSDTYGVVVFDEDGNMGMSMETTGKAEGQKQKQKTYVKDNYLYYNLNGNKIKMDISSELEGEFDMSGVLDMPSSQEMEVLFDESLGLSYDVYQNEGTTKFKIYGEVTDESDSSYKTTYEVYFVFENDVLTGVQYGMVTEDDGLYISMVMAMETYEGTIEYPSLEGYVEGNFDDLFVK